MKDAHLAKRKVLEALKKEMSSSDDGGLKDALPKMKQKVVVASDSPEGIKHGLDKAKEILSKRSSMMGDMPEGSDDEEMSESPEEEQSELDNPHAEADEESPEALKAQIAELKAQLARK